MYLTLVPFILFLSISVHVAAKSTKSKCQMNILQLIDEYYACDIVYFSDKKLWSLRGHVLKHGIIRKERDL